MNRRSTHLQALLLGVALSFGLISVTLALRPAFAQAVSGDITGIVSDTQGAVVIKADVSAKNVDTGIVSKTTTKENGVYRFFNLSPGKYDITVSAPGFSKSITKGFAVELNKVATANVTLKVSASVETVQVSDAGVSMDTTTAQVQTTFETIQLTELPAATNNVLNLSMLTAGISSNGGIGEGTGPSVGGQRPTDNNYTVEGIDNNDKGVTGPLVYVPSDAVSEFTALQNQYSSEYGHSNGGQFNTVIKSGTNQFHGLLYEYNQNKNYNAIDASTARSMSPGQEVPRFDNNRFGGQVGGPIIKNKLFFFSNYEQNPIGQPGVSTVYCAPTAAGFTLLDSLASEEEISSTNLSVYKTYSGTAATQALSGNPYCATTTSVAGVDIPIGAVPLSAGSYINNYDSTNSVDWTPNAKDNFRFRYIYNRIDEPDTYATLPTFWVKTPYRYHLATFSYFHTFSPNLTNEFRAGYNRYYNVVQAPSAIFPGLTVFPNLTFDDMSLNVGPDPNAPQASIQNTYQFSDSIIRTYAKHTFKIGAEFRDVISPDQFVQRQRGDYEWSNLGGYLLDLTPDVLGERDATVAGASLTYYGNLLAFYAYINDDWRISQKLTLNLGVRYEYTGIPDGERKQVENIAASVPGLISFYSPKAQLYNFMPRLGFAYALDSKTTIRGGFSMAYDVLYDNLGENAAPPQQASTEDVDLTSHAPDFLANGALPDNISFTTIADQRAATSAYIPNQKLPYAENFLLGVERTFGQNYTAEVRLVHTHALHLPAQTRINTQPITSSTNHLPMYFTTQADTSSSTFTLDDVINAGSMIVPAYDAAGFNQNFLTVYEPWASSNYNGLQTQLNRRFSNGLSLSAAYTWSKTMDDATAVNFSTVLTPRRAQNGQDLKADYSLSALSRAHRFTLAAVYDVPFFKNSNGLLKNTLGNWEFAPVYTFESPEYATVQSGVDVNLNGDSAGDRVYINPNGKPGTGSGVTAITNPALLDSNGDPEIVGYYATDPTAYYVAAAAGGASTTSKRNSLPTRPINNFDITVSKKVDFLSRYSVSFQAQIWNMFNHSQYTPGTVNNINWTSPTDSSTHNYLIPGQASFNQPNAVFANHARTMQLAMKFAF